MRVLLMAVGVAVAGYGGWLLVDATDGDEVVSLGAWLLGGVIAHDAAISAVAIGLVAIGARVLPTAAKAPAAVGLVVLGSFTIVAIPFLGRFGALEDNPTLLNGDYTTGYLVVTGLVLLGVGGATLLRRTRRSAPSNPE